MTPLEPARWAAIVPAAGAARRMGFQKVLAPLPGGEPVLARVLRLLSAAGVGELVVGVRPEDRAAIQSLVGGTPAGSAVTVVQGGATRQETVAACLAALSPGARYVLVHDAARPFCSPELVQRVQRETLQWGAACPALPLVDTVHAGDPEGFIAQTPDRSRLWQAQTPQGFRRELLEQAHRWARAHGRAGTDDAGLCAASGIPVRLVPGERTNRKLTEPADLPPSAPPLAVGQGYDIHRLVPGRPLRLGGVTIPYERGLQGHSDADALCHALADAILGAAGLGDIGQHFPPADPRYADADSIGLLTQTVQLAGAAGWHPVQADCLVTAEAPRLAPYVPAMRQRLASALGLPPERVNVKAGTHEGLDSLGRGEGIAAQAVVLLWRPPVA